MRFRVKRGGPAAGFTFDRTAKPVQRPEPEKPVSLAQALDAVANLNDDTGKARKSEVF